MLNNLLLVQVVNTSQLIKDMHELLSTQKIACLMETEPSTQMIASMPRNSVLFKVYNEKTRLREDMAKEEREIIKKDHCIVGRDASIYGLLGMDAFILAERKAVSTILVNSYLFERFFTKIWLHERPVYEYAQVIYYNRDKDPRIGRS